MSFDILRPWETLDEWQKEYIRAEGNCFLLCGRQVGKSTAASIKAVELAVHKHKKGENILILAYTEKQAYNLYSKCLAYASLRYKNLIRMGKERPTKHEFIINDVKIMCYATGLTGDGVRGLTCKKLIVDEAAPMNKLVFTSITPMLSVVNGSMDIISTPRGKEGFFYECSLDDNYKKFYISAEDCPRHDKKFLESERKRMSALEYAQEYQAVFLDELKRLFSDDVIKECCVLHRRENIGDGRYYLGVDVAGLGKDESTFEIVQKKDKEHFAQVENIIAKNNLTTETTKTIVFLEEQYKFRKIGIDDGGIGFGVFSELLNNDKTKRKVEALNNSHRPLDKDGKKSKKILKEDMYFNLLSLMEQGKIKLLDDDTLIHSLKSIQFEIEEKEGRQREFRIFGRYSHITEGLIRACWCAVQDKTLNIWCYFN